MSSSTKRKTILIKIIQNKRQDKMRFHVIDTLNKLTDSHTPSHILLFSPRITEISKYCDAPTERPYSQLSDIGQEQNQITQISTTFRERNDFPFCPKNEQWMQESQSSHQSGAGEGLISRFPLAAKESKRPSR